MGKEYLKYEEQIKQIVPADDSTDIDEKMILYNEIRKKKPKIVVETGTHRGLTTLYLAHACYDNGHGDVHTADPYGYNWKPQQYFNQFDELNKHITYYEVRGSQIPVEDIDFLFIDGYHEPEEVLEEIDALFPKLNKNATVFFHDTNDENALCDVKKALRERELDVDYIETKNGMAKYMV